MVRVLLAAKGWQERALLRAQLIEEGLSVEAFESVSEALEAIRPPAILPDLIIADLTDSHHLAGELAQLALWASATRIWIIASRSTLATAPLDRYGFERVLFRPVDVGQLVQQIKQTLASS